MASATVDISLNSSFGSVGSGNDQFHFPTGICVTGDNLFIVDKQNHRIKKHDLFGNYISEFGSVGSGNNQFYFPEDITTDGTYLYITDGANHRIKKHDLSGTYISEWGIRGIGNNEYEYPVGIDNDGVNLYIVDKGNSRIMVTDLSGTYVAKYGYYGNNNYNLNFPEGICCFDSTKIAICDSGNKRIIVRRASDGLYLNQFGSFTYPSRISNTNGILTVVDRQDNEIVTFDYDGNEIESYSTSLFFPEGIVYYNDQLFLCDSANHQIDILDFSVTFASSFFVQKLLNLTKQLYPTGRAWFMPKGGIFEKLHEGLAFSEARAYAAVIGQLDIILPDNENFSVEDATRWEEALGLYINTSLSLTERKEAIIRKMNYPGDTPERQSRSYIESQLQAAGFDVYVHENRFGSVPYTTYNPIPAIYGSPYYGLALYGSSGLSYTLIANYIDESKDATYSIGGLDNLKQTFFIGGSTFGTSANVDSLRKNEFREMILKLKPAQMAGFLLINYT